MGNRIIKLNALLRDEAAQAIKNEIDFELNVIITVTRANVSPTLENANISVSVYPENMIKKVLETLNKKIYNIQQVLNSRLKMRPVPKIRFEIDQSEKNAEKIDKLLRTEKNV